MQKKFILKNGMHYVILSLIAGNYLLYAFMYNYRMHHSFILISMVGASNVDRLRDFIKHVYVDRRFTGDKTNDKPPRAKPVRCLLSPFRFTVLKFIFQFVTISISIFMLRFYFGVA